MSWSLVGQRPPAGNPSYYQSSTPSTVVLNWAQTAGNLLVLALPITYLSTVSSVTDTAGNTWHKACAYAGAMFNCEIWYAYNIAAQSANANTITIVWGSLDYMEPVVMEFSNGAAITADPFDKSAGAYQTGTTTPNSGNTATTSVADELLIGVVDHVAWGNTLTWDSGWTDVTHPDDWAHVGYKIVSSVGAYNASGVFASSMFAVTTVIATFGVAAAPATKFRRTFSQLGIKAGKRQIIGV